MLFNDLRPSTDHMFPDLINGCTSISPDAPPEGTSINQKDSLYIRCSSIF